MTTATQTRIESLCKITNGKAEWYSTHKQLVQAETAANVSWDGNLGQHVALQLGKPVKTASGSWARQIPGTNRLAAMTEAECKAAGLNIGQDNFGDRV